MYWQMDHHVKRIPGRPRKNCIDTICQDVKTIDMAEKRLKNLQPTEKIGVAVWPNVSTTRHGMT